jgi:transcriptional regulator of arginine metabolism
MPETRESRLSLIRRFLLEEDIRSQEVLVQKLTAGGHSVTQSSVSRDLADLGVQKVKGRYTLRAGSDPSIGVLSLRPAGPHLLVLTTAVGAAQLVAHRLDHLGLPEIVGTVAGDDTIFVATASGEDQGVVVKALEATL